MNNKARFEAAFASARHGVRNNDAKIAIDSLVDMLSIIREEYTLQNDTMLKSKTRVLFKHWEDIAIAIKTNGITRDVQKEFNIPQTTPQTPNAKPEDDMPAQIKPQPHNPPLLHTPVNSQGWVADIFQRIKNAVVSVHLPANTGTGFVVSKNGYLLTNEHVIRSAKASSNKWINCTSIIFAGNKKLHAVEIIAADKKNDVALCSFNPNNIAKLTAVPLIKDYSTVQQGADVMVTGYGMSMGIAPFNGTIKFTCDDFHGDLIYTAPSNPGDSGAPVLNRDGVCIGINKSRMLNANAVTHATRMDIVHDLLHTWSKQFNLTL